MNKEFAVFILTNGRPDNVITYNTLKKYGYTGPIYLIIDNLDKTKDSYIKLYGEQVIIFDKVDISKRFDSGDNFNDMRAIFYARNACFEVAQRLGIKYFLQLDDDYKNFTFRYDNNLKYHPKIVRNLDLVFKSFLDFYKKINAKSVAFMQGGDFIGGEECDKAKSLKLYRKVMNSFLCSTERPFNFIGRINEDVNTYTRTASTGNLFLSINQVSLDQLQTQSNAGGMTELYLDSGTYIKSFYSVMYHPSSVKVSVLRDRLAARLHHSVSWNYTVPKILNESHKK